MRHDFKIFDSDTHLNPSAETLEPYFDTARSLAGLPHTRGAR